MNNIIYRRQPLRGIFGGLLLLAAASAAAGPLPPGGETFTNGIDALHAPHLVAVFVQDQAVPFSFTGAHGLLTGTIVQTVTRSVVDNTLDFYWQVSLDNGSVGQLSALGISGFALPSGSALWADYRSDSRGDVAPLSATRSFGEGTNILFELLSLAPAQTTFPLLLDTQATSFALDGTMSLLALDGSVSLSMPAFVPTPVPEPSTYGLLGLGLAALALRKRRSSVW